MSTGDGSGLWLVVCPVIVVCAVWDCSNKQEKERERQEEEAYSYKHTQTHCLDEVCVGDKSPNKEAVHNKIQPPVAWSTCPDGTIKTVSWISVDTDTKAFSIFNRTAQEIKVTEDLATSLQTKHEDMQREINWSVRSGWTFTRDKQIDNLSMIGTNNQWPLIEHRHTLIVLDYAVLYVTEKRTKACDMTYTLSED